MSKITGILSYANFELIRSKIASILATELTAQLALNVAARTAELLKETPDTALVALYDLNISCIPSKVYEEKFIRPNPNDYPLINVVLTNVPLNDGTSNTVQYGVNKYQIEFYQDSKSQSANDGDVLATIKLHRIMAICRQILMYREYDQLDLGTMIGYRIVQDMMIAQPNTGADNSHHAIFGKFDLMVKVGEVVSDLEGAELQESDTTMTIYDSELGYFWEIINE